MIRILASLLLVMLAAGCGAGTQGRWTFEKVGVSEADAKKDRSQCFAAAIEDTQGTTNVGVFKVDRAAYKACMERRGYTLRAGQ